MKILLFGRNGQLGWELQRSLAPLGDLVALDARGDASGPADFEPKDPAGFAHDLAAAINSLLDDPERLRKMGARSRERVEHFFSWTSIARWTVDFYWDLIQA